MSQATPSPYRSRLPVAHVVAALGLVGAMAVIQRAMGRIWWCKCGAWTPFSFQVWSMHNSQHLVDPYTPSHILHGLIFYAALSLRPIASRTSRVTRALIAVGVEVAWELLENSPIIIDRYREVTASLDYAGDSVLNSVSDVVACLLGFWFASRAPTWASILLLVVAEVGCAIWIRDNLTLNVLMLLWPVDAIRQWQMGAAPV